MNGTRRFQRAATGILVSVLAAAVAPGQQAAPPVIDEWRLLEPAQEMIDYKNKLKDGVFDDASRTFLVKTALPQLALPKNRPTIDRLRRRMRELLCSDTGDADEQKAGTSATQTVADFMVAVARDGKADAVVRVNAALLVGELTGPGRKPWTPGVAPLVAMVGDGALPPAVRIAAAAGLARHVDADAVARSADVGPALVKLLGEPFAGVDPLAADWLRSRSLAMLTRMGADAPAGAAAAAAGELLDDGRPVDVRVRAAAAVGRTAKAPDDVDVAAAVAAIRGLATAFLAATQADSERRDLVARVSGPGDQPPQALPGMGPEATGAGATDGTLRYRRDAWRLATLADALASADGESGLARIAGATAPAVSALADGLRAGAQALDAEPSAESLTAAVDALAAATAGPPAAVQAGAGEARPAEPVTPAEEPAGGVPFGDR